MTTIKILKYENYCVSNIISKKTLVNLYEHELRLLLDICTLLSFFYKKKGQYNWII